VLLFGLLVGWCWYLQVTAKQVIQNGLNIVTAKGKLGYLCETHVMTSPQSSSLYFQPKQGQNQVICNYLGTSRSIQPACHPSLTASHQHLGNSDKSKGQERIAQGNPHALQLWFWMKLKIFTKKSSFPYSRNAFSAFKLGSKLLADVE
jgi:hypothetical protein